MRNQPGYSHHKTSSRLDKVVPGVKSEKHLHESRRWYQATTNCPPQGERNPSCGSSGNRGSHIYIHVAKNLGAAGFAELWPQEE